MKRTAPAAALLLLAACAGPAEAPPAREAPGPVVTVPAQPDDVPSRADEARDRAKAAVAGARDELSGVRAAQHSVGEALAAMRGRLGPLREQALDAGLTSVEAEAAALAERLESLAADSSGLLAAVQRVEVQIDEFETWAAGVYERALKGHGTDAAVRADLTELETEADGHAHNRRLQDYATRSGSYLRALGELDAELVALERALATGRAAAAAAVATSADKAGAEVALPVAPPSAEVAEIVTSEGTLVLELFADVAPRHVANFTRLARDGFYDGLTFHRIIPGFVVQGGCPRGDGNGGPGYTLEREPSDRPFRRGTLGMARFGHPDSAGSQFFVALDELPELEGRYTVFGQLLRGSETLARLEELGSESGVPRRRVVIEKVVVRERLPEDAPAVAQAPAGKG